MASDPAQWFDAIVRGIEAIAVIGGGLVIVYRVGGVVTKFEQSSEQQAKELFDVKSSIKELTASVNVLMQTKAEFNFLTERQIAQGKRLDELYRLWMGGRRVVDPTD